MSLSFRMLWLSLLGFASISAQEVVTEAAVNFEKRFIEAKQQALLGNREKAITAFETLAQEAPTKDVLFFELGRLHYSLEQFEAAINSLNKAYTIQPLPVYAHLLGKLYLSTGQYKAGAKLFSEMVNHSPDKPTYYLQQADFLVKAQELEAALKVYNALEKKQGVHPEISRLKHNLYLNKGDFKKAENELIQLVAAFPAVLDFKHLLAGYYEDQGNKNAAKAMYETILQLAPDDVKAQLAISQTASRPNSPTTELLSLFSKAEVPIDLKIGKLLPLVQAVAQTKNTQKADEGLLLAQELCRVHPDEAKAWAITADLYFHSYRYAEAAAAYQKTLALDDTVYPVWEQLLQSLYLQQQIKELRDWAEKALDVFPNQPYLYFYAALGAAGQHDFNEATSLLEQAIFIFSAADAAAAAMASSYNNTITALAAQQLPTLDPQIREDDPLRLYITAATALQKGNSREAITLLIAQDHPKNSHALQLELLGDSYLAAGEKTAAQNAYERARAAASKSRQLNTKIAQTKS